MGPSVWNASCPAPIGDGDVIHMAHGGGGRRMRHLIQQVFASAFASPFATSGEDGVVLPALEGLPVMTTDSYVVDPLFFPGGDIGCLAVYGTLNDLTMMGATPKYLSVGFVLEEGLPIATLEAVVASMAQAARLAEVHIVTGDTKVVQRGHGHGLYVNTTGLGVLANDRSLSVQKIQVGDAILVSGDLGRHGVAVLCAREGMGFDPPPESDAACLYPEVSALLTRTPQVACLRDLTRGGLSAALNEIALDRGLVLEIDEEAVPVSEPVASASELLGLDPMAVACEGRFVAYVPEAYANDALKCLQATQPALRPARIGSVIEAGTAQVRLRTRLGTRRMLDYLSGEQLPRIC